MMIQAVDFHDALKNLDRGMSGTMGDYAIVSITETAIMDVLRPDLGEKKEEE